MEKDERTRGVTETVNGCADEHGPCPVSNYECDYELLSDGSLPWSVRHRSEKAACVLVGSRCTYNTSARTVCCKPRRAA
jgi:hypothetical protein